MKSRRQLREVARIVTAQEFYNTEGPLQFRFDKDTVTVFRDGSMIVLESSGSVRADFLYLYMKTYLPNYMKGRVGVLSDYRKEIMDMMIPVPLHREQRSIVDKNTGIEKSFTDEIGKLVDKKQALVKARDQALYDLFFKV